MMSKKCFTAHCAAIWRILRNKLSNFQAFSVSKKKVGYKVSAKCKALINTFPLLHSLKSSSWSKNKLKCR